LSNIADASHIPEPRVSLIAQCTEDSYCDTATEVKQSERFRSFSPVFRAAAADAGIISIHSDHTQGE